VTDLTLQWMVLSVCIHIMAERSDIGAAQSDGIRVYRHESETRHRIEPHQYHSLHPPPWSVGDSSRKNQADEPTVASIIASSLLPRVSISDLSSQILSSYTKCSCTMHDAPSKLDHKPIQKT
jgi:hypothetical protein